MHWRRMGEWTHKSLFLTSVLLAGELSVSLHRPFLLLWKNHPIPLEGRAGWDPEPVWSGCKSERDLPHRDSNLDPSVIRLIVVPIIKLILSTELGTNRRSCPRAC
jgi:hypothetical protein